MSVINRPLWLARISPLVVLMVSMAFTYPRDALALTQTGTVDNLRYSVYAPDWTWQKRDINILVVLQNGGEERAEVSVTLVFPPGKEDHFRYDGERAIDLAVPAGKGVRHAFTNIVALDRVARQVYKFELVVACEGREARIAYPVRTIRGAVVSPGKWALFLPGGVALAWCLVFLAIIRRYAKPGAWRVPAEPVREPDMVQPWIQAGTE
jgi:hypothetical protein